MNSCGVQRVLQLCLQRLQLLSQIPALFLGLGSGLPLQLQVLLQLGELRLQFPDLLLGRVLRRSLLLDSGVATTKQGSFKKLQIYSLLQ